MKRAGVTVCTVPNALAGAHKEKRKRSATIEDKYYISLEERESE